MFDRSRILDRYKDYDDRILANSIIDAAEYCIVNFDTKATHFLDPRQQIIVFEILDKLRGISYTAEGGIYDSERKLLIIRHEDIEADEESEQQALISLIRFNWYHSTKKLSHRDFLGSLIGNGIKREMLGDIIVEDSTACMACKSEVADFILLNVTKIGSVPVKAELEGNSISKQEKTKLINTTVASLRLDTIISSGYGISRSKALDVIKSGKVRINWTEVDSPSKEVKEGDTISLRGKGRIVLEEVAGNTKKDRIRVAITKYM